MVKYWERTQDKNLYTLIHILLNFSFLAAIKDWIPGYLNLQWIEADSLIFLKLNRRSLYKDSQALLSFSTGLDKRNYLCYTALGLNRKAMAANQHKAKHGAAHAMTELCQSKDALDFLTMAQKSPPHFHPQMVLYQFLNSNLQQKQETFLMASKKQYVRSSKTNRISKSNYFH